MPQLVERQSPFDCLSTWEVRKRLDQLTRKWWKSPISVETSDPHKTIMRGLGSSSRKVLAMLRIDYLGDWYCLWSSETKIRKFHLSGALQQNPLVRFSLNSANSCIKVYPLFCRELAENLGQGPSQGLHQDHRWILHDMLSEICLGALLFVRFTNSIARSRDAS